MYSMTNAKLYLGQLNLCMCHMAIGVTGNLWRLSSRACSSVHFQQIPTCLQNVLLFSRLNNYSVNTKHIPNLTSITGRQWLEKQNLSASSDTGINTQYWNKQENIYLPEINPALVNPCCFSNYYCRLVGNKQNLVVSNDSTGLLK